MRCISRASCLLLGLSSILVLGCESQPPPGRIDPYSTSKDERTSSGADVPSMLEFSDQVAEKLAQDISQIPELRDAPTQLVLALGDLNNKSGTPTTDFELLQKRIRSKLINSKFIRDRFIIIEDPARVQRLLDHLNGGPDAPGVQRYDPNSTYLLNGDFLEANRNARSQYLFSFNLTQLKRGTIVFEKSYDLGQIH